jgi:hypothetical protein
MDEVELTGKVILQIFGEGSKSEHDAVYIDTGREKYRLRRKGGNPFHDSALNELVGKRVRIKGNLTSHFFIITTIPEELK